MLKLQFTMIRAIALLIITVSAQGQRNKSVSITDTDLLKGHGGNTASCG